VARAAGDSAWALRAAQVEPGDLVEVEVTGFGRLSNRAMAAR
jgi:2-keto-4-pentenoate hydratase/2-oxohepta-3-ene-1,7-dioic acid hydratase in catechol pathway